MDIQYYENLDDVKVPHVFVFATNAAGIPGHEHSKTARDRYGRTPKAVYMETTHKGSSYGVVTRDANLVRMLDKDQIELQLQRLAFDIVQDPERRQWLISHLHVGVDYEPRKWLKTVVRKHLATPPLRDRVRFQAMIYNDPRIRSTDNPTR